MNKRVVSYFSLLSALVKLSLILMVLSVECTERPNIIIVIADDMGWRDTGYSGNPVVKTPHLDEMAAHGLRFDYFYSAAHICSPGRAAILTGRNPVRTGVRGLGEIRPQEITYAQALKLSGYSSAYFGKYHLVHPGNKTTPMFMGFAQATWSYNFYDNGAQMMVGEIQKDALSLGTGDSSLAIMDLALKHIRQQATQAEPFLVTVAFGSPHLPYKVAPEFAALYDHLKLDKNEAGTYGEISGLDMAIGNLRSELRKLSIAENTIIWFMSDNGGKWAFDNDPSGRGKGSFGARTCALLEWPKRITKPNIANLPVYHQDVYPTLLDITETVVPKPLPLDGISILPLMDGVMKKRPKPMGFVSPDLDKANKGRLACNESVWLDGNYMLIAEGEIQLHDIYLDPAHKNNLAASHPEVVAQMTLAMKQWQESVQDSFAGKDYNP